MKMLSLRACVTAVSVVDVLLGAAVITIYVYLLADNVHELDIIHGSKVEEIVFYVFVSFTTLIRSVVAFHLYNSITKPPELEDIHDMKRKSRWWIAVSVALLMYWSAKALLFDQMHAGVSALVLCYVEICFRLCGICIVKLYLKMLNKQIKEQQRHF